MFADAVIGLSVVVGTLVVVDFLLTPAQTKWLSDRVLHFWTVLDDTKKGAYLDFIISTPFRVVAVITCVLVTAATVWWITGDFSHFWQWYLVALSLAASLLVIRIGFTWFFLAVAASGFILAIVLAGIIVFFAVGVLILSWATNPASILGVILYTLSTVFLAVALVLGLTVAPAIVAYVLTFLLYPIEFLVRRIAEYPKGPVLALSAFGGGLAALFKIFV